MKKCMITVVPFVVLLSLFLISCEESGPQFSNEGTPDNPVYIGSAVGGSTSRNCEVGRGSSYYYVTVTDSVNYLVQVTGMSDDADLGVWDSGYNFLDESFNAGSADESVVVTAVGSPLYIRVDWWYGPDGGTLFTLTVTEQ